MEKREVKATRHWEKPGCPIDMALVEIKDHRIEMHYQHFVDLFNVRMAVGESVTFRVMTLMPGSILAR